MAQVQQPFEIMENKYFPLFISKKKQKYEHLISNKVFYNDIKYVFGDNVIYIFEIANVLIF